MSDLLVAFVKDDSVAEQANQYIDLVGSLSERNSHAGLEAALIMASVG